MSSPTLMRLAPAPTAPALAPRRDPEGYRASVRRRAHALADAPEHARPGHSSRAHALAGKALSRSLRLWIRAH